MERKMKEEIDDRILSMREARLHQALGKELARIIKIYIKARRHHDEEIAAAISAQNTPKPATPTPESNKKSVIF
jgi:hypothetical protein